MYKTKAIILKTIKYGETSLVVTAFTEAFGVQTYMVNGVRTAKKNGQKASLFQPGSILQMDVYYNERNTMHRIKEYNRTIVYEQVLTHVLKNSIAVFLMEMLYKLLKQPEQNIDLFYFCEDILLHLDKASAKEAANYPLFIALQLSHFFGFKIDDNYSTTNIFVDLQEGYFVHEQPTHGYFLANSDAFTTSELLKTMLPNELANITLNHITRRHLLAKYVQYYQLHLPDFGELKTLQVMQEVLG